MEQLNTESTTIQEVEEAAGMTVLMQQTESPLLIKVRHKFTIFGGISLLFGGFFTLLFYKADLGLNILLFSMIIITLLCTVMKVLQQPIKTGTVFYYIAVILLGLSTMLTSSGILHFLNILGILLLLDLSLLHQFCEDERWDFVRHFLRMVLLVFQSIAAIGKPFVDCFHFLKHRKVFRNDKVRNVFIGLLISVPLLWMITALLVNADFMFSELTRNIYDAVFQEDFIAIAFMILFGFLACYCIICASVANSGRVEKKTSVKADAYIAVTVLLILCLVYLVFCGIQIIYLFAGGLFVLPENYTFAEYARRGFFELLAVAIINVMLMVLIRSFFEENRVLRLIITCMTACTYIMIASAAYRMLLYIGAYHLTFLRVFVLLALFIIALVLTGVIIAVYRKKFPLFQYCVAVVSVCYLLFSFSRPDYYIAEYLIQHAEHLDQEDMVYLVYNLSADAAPVVLPLLNEEDRWTLDSQGQKVDYGDERYLEDISESTLKKAYSNKIREAAPSIDFRDFTYSGYLAEKYTKEYPLK